MVEGQRKEYTRLWIRNSMQIHHGFWLYRAEQDNAFVTNCYKDWDCKTNGLLTTVENTIRPIWKSGYVTYKKAVVAGSCYINDSWERLKLPFSYLNEWLWAKISGLSGTSLGFLVTAWDTFWQGLRNLLALSWNSLSNVLYFVFDFLSDFIYATGNLFRHLLTYFTDNFYIIGNALSSLFGNTLKFFGDILSSVKSYLYLLLFAPREKVKYVYEPAPEVAKEACSLQQKSIEKLSSEMEDFKSFSLDLSAIKRKIDELELELRKEKASRLNQDESHDKKLEENLKTLQKHQAIVNNALVSTKRQSDFRSTSILHYVEKLFSRSQAPSIQYNTLEANLNGSDLSVSYIKKLIADAIKLYDADKTGRVDYALETAGGQVQSIRCTETYIASPKSYVLLGWSVYTKTSSPRDAISPGMAAGQCWAFVGSQGFLVIQLSHTIKVTGFTMEHISKTLVPRGHIESAPKGFSMWGLKSEHDPEPYLFGEYTYLDNDETLQYFPVTYPTSERYNMVELKINSNHGNPNYTCLYRIRVHGDLLPTKL